MSVAAVDEILLRAQIGACITALMLGPLGCFVVWRRMAYFGDTIAHASLLGVALSLLMPQALPMSIAIFAVAILVALLLTRFTRDTRLQADTMLGILAHSALSLGLVLVALNREVRVDVNGYLFGDVLTIDWQDVATLAALAVIVLTTLALHWKKLLMTTIQPDIARVEGVRTERAQLVLTLLLAALIAVAIKLTGMLLITALLIIPPATARYFAKSPLQMAVLASVVGIASVSGGLYGALQFDLPAGPMMVVAAALLFTASALIKRR